MLVTLVHVTVKPEYTDKFISATIENHKSSVTEPGNLRFDVLQNRENPSLFTLYEAYESDEASAAHKKTPHYLKWKEKVEPWMAEPRKGVHHSVIEPLDKRAWKG